MRYRNRLNAIRPSLNQLTRYKVKDFHALCDPFCANMNTKRRWKQNQSVIRAFARFEGHEPLQRVWQMSEHCAGHHRQRR